MSVLTFVTIDDFGNPADDTGYGAVSYTYDISKFAITEFNIAEYNADPANSTRQITLFSRGPDKPATSVSWNEAARYVNWLNVLDGAQPAYRFTTAGVNDAIALWDVADSWTDGGENRFRHKDAKYWLPSEDEWYKAAYYNGSVYFDYPTGSNIPPTSVASGTDSGTAVYSQPAEPGPAEVTQAGGLSPYGTMGQGGNAYEWTETTFDGLNNSAVGLRAGRGGEWFDVDPVNLQSVERASESPDLKGYTIGFRVAKVPRRQELTFVTIGDAGNTADITGVDNNGFYGQVDYTYKISKFAITEFNIAEYNADPINSTLQIGTDGRGDNKPATFISWNEAARYVNWLNIVEGAQPAYNFTTGGVNDDITLWDAADAWRAGGLNLFRHRDAKYFLPSADEWYKAAYYKGGYTAAGYWIYPTGSNTVPASVASGTDPDTAVYDNSITIDPADVTQAGGLSPYGTMGQGSNINEWCESTANRENLLPGDLREDRGTPWYGSATFLQSQFSRDNHLPNSRFENTGLRVAGYVPPPGPPPNTSPVLNVADNLKIGSTQVTAAYLGSVRVWPSNEALWRFDSPGGSTITGFKITTSSGDVIIDWGDGTSDTVSSGQVINKTY